MNKKYLFLSILLIAFELHAQFPDQSARPLVGWDSLKSLIRYPELARRAEIEQYVYVTVELDSTGNVRNINVCGHYNYLIFEQPIKDAISSVRWLPEISNGTKRNAIVQFQIQFKFRQRSAMPKRVDLIIEADKPIIPPIIKLD
jgi:TonB family protein